MSDGSEVDNMYIPKDANMCSLGKLAEALAAAQGEIVGAAKSKKNPHFQSRYADLAAVWEACRAPLAKHKLAVIQTTHHVGERWVLRTTLAHISGEQISGDFPLAPTKPDMQGMMAALTYARRGGLAAMVGVAAEDEDDDGNTAAGHTQIAGATKDTSPPPQVKEKAKPRAEQFEPADADKPPIKKWCDAAYDEIATATKLDTILAWETENQDAMNRLQYKWSMQYNRLRTILKEKMVELEPANA